MDVMEDLAKPLPLMVICEMVGAPQEDRLLFKQWADDAGKVADVEQTEETIMATFLAFVQVRNYVHELVNARRESGHLGEDILGALILAEDQGDRLNDEEIAGFCLNLLLAGHETTMAFIGTAVYLLLQHPRELARLRDDLSLLPNAIEELLRYEPPVQMAVAPRLATEDIEIGGQLIQKGQTVRVVLAAANRDPSQFTCPDQLDISRSDQSHLSFATGIHTCIGAHLARMEAQVALASLFERLPNIRLAGEKPQWRRNSVSRRLESLSVRF
jgi:cytochrome P450